MKINFSFANINVRSITKNFAAFKDSTFDLYDIITIDESWLKPDIPDNILELPGYSLIRSDRYNKRGGGVAVYLRDNIFKYSVILTPQDQSEQLWIQVEFLNSKFALCVFYRPQNFPMNTFLQELENNLSNFASSHDFVIITGDFNEDYLTPNHNVTKLNKILQAFSLKQIVDKPTRYTQTSAKLLDYIICNEDIQVSNVYVSPTPLVADHCLVAFNAQLNLPEFEPYEFTYRKYIKNHSVIAREFRLIPFDNILYERNINLKVGLLNQYLFEFLNKIAPFKTVRVTKPKAWLSESIKKARQEK